MGQVKAGVGCWVGDKKDRVIGTGAESEECWPDGDTPQDFGTTLWALQVLGPFVQAPAAGAWSPPLWVHSSSINIVSFFFGMGEKPHS